MTAHSALLLAALALASRAFAADAPRVAGLIDLGGERAVLVDGTLSPDGRYAAGWTVRPKKGQPAVRWEERDKEDGSFREHYIESDGYILANIIVDLARRRIAATLAFTEPYFGGKNHGALEAVFGPERDGHRFAIVLSDGKWDPFDVALLDLSADAAAQSDLLKTLDAAIHKHLAKARVDPGSYSTTYLINNLPELGLLTGFADADTVRVPFSAEVPKSERDRAFEGAVQLRLTRGKDGPHAEAIAVHEGKPDPTQDDPRIAAADKELNAAYAARRASLAAPAKAKLLEEQRAWIIDRDQQCAAVREEASAKSHLANPRAASDRLLLKLTQERAAILRAR